MAVPTYSSEELESRIADGSIDLSRLAATVHAQQVSVAALVNWVNERIAAETQAAEQPPASRGGKKG